MSRQIQIRRGSADEHKTFTGVSGEITMDTTNNTLRIHDGATLGGTVLAKKSEIPSDIIIADYVIETWCAPDGDVWYRKYKSGWVEQGGRNTSQQITLPLEMRDANYDIQLTGVCSSGNNNVYIFGFRNVSPFGFVVQGNVVNNTSQTSGANSQSKCWRVSGYAAQI